jgi:HEPN domain-containing protein
MPRDPALLAETSAWIRKAAEDLKAAELLLEANPPLASLVAFHAQQAAEKSQKAFLVWNRHHFRKTHDLAELGEQCVKIDSTLDHVSSQVAPISGYSEQSRYPGGWEEPSPDEAREALNLAREMFDAILSRLPAEIRL